MSRYDSIKQEMLKAYREGKRFDQCDDRKGLSFSYVKMGFKYKNISSFYEYYISGSIDDQRSRIIITTDAGFGIEFQCFGDSEPYKMRCKLFDLWVHNDFTDLEVLNIARLLFDKKSMIETIKEYHNKYLHSACYRLSEYTKDYFNVNLQSDLKLVRHLLDYESENKALIREKERLERVKEIELEQKDRKVPPNSSWPFNRINSEEDSFQSNYNTCARCSKTIPIGEIYCESCKSLYQKKRRGMSGY